MLLHTQEAESHTQQTTRIKNVFFTHNKEKATRNRFRGVKSDENKLYKWNALLLHTQEGESHTQQTTRIKNVFFTHNKEKATRNRFRGFKSDENKLNISKTPCFSTHTRSRKPHATDNKNNKTFSSHTRRRKPHATDNKKKTSSSHTTRRKPQENRFKG